MRLHFFSVLISIPCNIRLTGEEERRCMSGLGRNYIHASMSFTTAIFISSFCHVASDSFIIIKSGSFLWPCEIGGEVRCHLSV